MSEMEIDEQGRLHAMLCAYVLGEADAKERAEVEAALARDSGLREERARLEATIGLVQGSLGKDEVLPYDATREVTRAAELLATPPASRAPTPWYRSGSLRAAASIVALVGVSFIGWQAFVVRDGDLRVARLDDEAKNERAKTLDDARSSRGAAARPETTQDSGGMTGGLAFDEPAPQSGTDTSLAEGEEVAREALLAIEPALEANPTDAAEKDRLVDVAAARSRLDARKLELKQDLDTLVVSGPGANTAGGAPRTEGAAFAPAGAPSTPPSDARLSGLGDLGGSAASDSNGLGLLGRMGEQPTGAPAAVEAAEATDRFFGFGSPATPAGGAGGGGGSIPAEALAVGSETRGRTLIEQKPAATTASGGPGSPGPAGASAAPTTPSANAPGRKSDLAVASGEETMKSKSRLGGADKSVEAKVAELSDVWGEQSAGASRFAGLSEFEKRDELNSRVQDRLRVDGDDSRPTLTHVERQAHLEQIIAACRPLPGERPRDMFYRFFGDNPFEWTATDRLSTFAMDVDTASYTLARRYLVEGHLPEKAQIRTEEFVNYFAPDVAAPGGGNTFAIRTELAPGRYSDSPDKWMLRVAVRGREVPVAERDPMALTFVIDVSGSMKEGQRLELVKQSLRTLVEQLDGRDSISIVAFSADSRLILPMTSAAKRGLIESAIAPLAPDGGTNTEAGLRMGYEQALASLATHTNNRVVLLTDGVANVGVTDPAQISQQVERQRKAGIYLNTIGVGMNNVNDHLLEQLADKGDGLCNYVDDAQEMRHALVDNFMRTLVPIARDAKVQVEFDPAQVQSYRLLGYENRAIADDQFRDDRVDAGEIHSGHQVTALYEIVRVGSPATTPAPLAKVMVRYKPPHKDGVAQAASEEASEISLPVFAREAAASFEATSFGYRRAVLAGQFAEFLRRSVHSRGDSLDRLVEDTRKLAAERVGDVQVKELADMVLQSKLLLDADLARYSRLQARVDELRRHCYERERLASLHRESDREILQRIDQQVASLERALRDELEERRVK